MPRVYNKHHKNAPKDAVYVGRPSKWGNPYAISGEITREKAVEYYRQHVRGKEEAIRTELRGRDLVCFCAPLACHADILLEIANDLSDRESTEPGSPLDSPNDQADGGGSFR